ncbi:hypothetical protein [Halorarius litoreus]|uniref:hypothetical protein n=1 Tax=Halorarius litoreus TaxID=2962676 RepID=UPI0020CC127C|nr:hypothetical protein [Halorarius litoreus]
MDDLVADALAAHREAAADVAEEFGPPRILYVGCGPTGARRVLTDDARPETDLEIRRMAVDADLEDPVGLDDADLRVVTLDAGDPGAVDIAATVADDDGPPTLVVVTLPDDDPGALDRLASTPATLLPLDAGLVDAEGLAADYAAAFVDALRRSLAFPTDAGAVYGLLAGGVAVPVAGDVDYTADPAPDERPFDHDAVREALGPCFDGRRLAVADRASVGWFGHATVDEAFELRGAYQLEGLLPELLAPGTDGVLTGRVEPSRDTPVSLCCLRILE